MKEKLTLLSCGIAIILGAVIIGSLILRWVTDHPLQTPDLFMAVFGLALMAFPVFGSIEFEAGTKKVRISLKKLSKVSPQATNVLLCLFVVGALASNILRSHLIGTPASTSQPASASEPGSGTTFVTIGTGGTTGIYYPTGGAIAKVVNREKDTYNLRIAVESTGGSVFNVNAVMAGGIQFGVARSDKQYRAVKGLAEWKDKGPQSDLRAVFSIYTESVTLVAGVSSGINTVFDLRGKRVSIGNLGSSQRRDAIDALQAAGIDFSKDMITESLKSSEVAGLLQDGRIDAFFCTVGHPSNFIKETTSGTRKVHLVSIPNAERLIKAFPFYVKSIIPIKFYPEAENTHDIDTFGIKATLVTTTKVPENVVYVVTKEVFDNFDTFKSMHPAYADLTKAGMLEGLSAKIHPGAMKYYKEAGLLR